MLAFKMDGLYVCFLFAQHKANDSQVFYLSKFYNKTKMLKWGQILPQNMLDIMYGIKQ